jgi:outer membrane lipoprotein SlyB
MFPQPIDFSQYNQAYIEDVREQSKQANAQTGGAIGSAAGMAIGGALGSLVGNPLAGASIGGALGQGAGNLIGGSIQDKEAVAGAEATVANAQANIQGNTSMALDNANMQQADFGFNQRSAAMRKNVMPKVDYLKFLN